MKTLTLLTLILFTGTSGKPIIPDHNPEKAYTMRQIIQQLDSHLKQNAPELYSTLKPPLTNAQIDALETQYSIKLPADVREIYLWKNGQDEESYKSLYGNKTFLSLEQAIEARDFLNEELFAKTPEDQFKIKNWWNKDWIPLFYNGGGDYVCYDPMGIFTNKPGQIIDYYHDAYYRMVSAPSLAAHLQAVSWFLKRNMKMSGIALRKLIKAIRRNLHWIRISMLVLLHT